MAICQVPISPLGGWVTHSTNAQGGTWTHYQSGALTAQQATPYNANDACFGDRNKLSHLIPKFAFVLQRWFDETYNAVEAEDWSSGT